MEKSFYLNYSDSLTTILTLVYPNFSAQSNSLDKNFI